MVLTPVSAAKFGTAITAVPVSSRNPVCCSVLLFQCRIFDSLFCSTWCPETVNVAEKYVFTLVIKNSIFLAGTGSWLRTEELHQHGACSLQPASVAGVVDKFFTFLRELWTGDRTFNQTKNQDQEHRPRLSYNHILRAPNRNVCYRYCHRARVLRAIWSRRNSWSGFCVMLTFRNPSSCKTGG